MKDPHIGVLSLLEEFHLKFHVVELIHGFMPALLQANRLYERHCRQSPRPEPLARAESGGNVEIKHDENRPLLVVEWIVRLASVMFEDVAHAELTFPASHMNDINITVTSPVIHEQRIDNPLPAGRSAAEDSGTG